MAESGIKEIGVDLIKDSIEVISNCPNSDSWSLGCDITIDDVNAELQEIRVADIMLSGNITTGEIAVDIDSQKEVIDLGISAIVNGINSALTESQIVPYEDILKITTISPEATNETRYASSAFSAKAIYDLITFLGRRVDTLESTNEQGGVINKDVADRLDKLEKNQFFERYDDQTIKTKYNLFSDHEISAFGLNAGTGGGSGGECGASHLKDLWDVTIVSAANNDILVYNGIHWVNKPQSSIMPDLSVLNNYLLKTEAAELYLVKDAAKDFASASSVTDLSNALVRLSETYGNRLNALEKIVQWFHLTQDEQAIYTEKNFYSEKEISAHGLNLGGGSGEGGAIELGNIIGVSLHSPVTGDVFVYNGTHWTNISQSELVPDLSGYATTDSVSTVSKRVNTVDNKVKSLEDRLNDLESEKLFFKLEGADDLIYTPHNLFSEKEISAHGLNYGSGSGASGLLTDLLDVKAEDSISGDLLVFDGTHWINTPQSAIVPSIDTSVIATREWVGQNYASTSDLSNGVKDAKTYTDALRTHVNEQDQILSGQISKILDWFTLEDGVLLTKYNLASEKEVSAKGINASQGGGTSYNRLDSWSAYDSSKAGYVLSALLGYDLHSRVTTLENAEVDLSDYYTKSQTNSQIASAIGAIDLNPYATKAALNILEGKHNTLRSEFDALNNLLSSDTTDYINTWNEVVAFLDGYKDESDLATILSGMNADISSRLLTSTFESWKADTYTPLANLVANHTTRLNGIDTSITNINTRLEGVDKTIEDHIAEFTAFRANFEISDNLILVRKNFASTEEVSAKGINQGTGGGGGSSYSRLDTWEGYDNNKAGYVLSAGLGYGLKVAIDELNGYDLNNRVRSIENSYVSKDAGGVVNGGLIANSFAVSGGSSSQFLKADGSLDSTSYLPTSGGVVSGLVFIKTSDTNPLQIFSSSGVQSGTIWYVNDIPKSWFGYDANGTHMYDYAHAAILGIATDGVAKFNNYPLLHEGNVGDYAMQYYGTNMPSNIVNYVGYGKPAEGWDNFGPAISFGYGAYYAQMQMASNGSIFSRISWEGSNSDWKTLAFTDSDITGNAATASSVMINYTTNDKLYEILFTNPQSDSVAKNDAVYRSNNTRFAYNPYHNILHVSRIASSGIATDWNDTWSDGTNSNPWYGLNFNPVASIYGVVLSGYYGITLKSAQGGVFLNSIGNVGIGTSLPSERLDVDGNTRVRGDIVTERIIIGGVTLSTEDGVLKIESDMYATGEISAHGLNKGESGGGGSSYSRLDTWIGYDSSKAGYVLSAGLGYDLKLAVDELNGYNLNSRLTTVESNYLSKNGGVATNLTVYGGTINGDFIIDRSISTILYYKDGVRLGFMGFRDELEPIIYDAAGHYSYDILHTGNIGSYAITTSGGTINSSEMGVFSIKRNAPNAASLMKFENSDGTIGYLGASQIKEPIFSPDLATFHFLIHTGNIGSYALSTSGGTINGYFGAFSVKRYEPYSSAIKFENSVGILGYIGISDDYTPLIWDKDLNTRTLIHSGNIGSQSVAYASNAGTLAGISLSDGSNTPWGTIPKITEAGWMDVGKYFEFHYDNTTGSDYSTVLSCAGNYGNFVYLPSASGTLALLTDNVAGAQKLVDGSGNPIIHNSGATFYIGDTIYPTIPTHILGSEIVLRYGTSATNGLIIDSSGNVTVGNGYFAGGGTKLYVDGGIRFTPRTIWGQSFDGTGNVDGKIYQNNKWILGVHSDGNLYMGFDTYGSNDTLLFGRNLYIFTSIGQTMTINSSGNVGIGTTNPQYKLHVEGTGYFSGALTANGGLTVNGILTVGGASIHPTANNPYFQLYQNNNYWYWQADDNYTYIGGTMSKALRIDQDGNTLIRGSLGVTGDATANRLVVGTDGMLCNGPATFNDFIYGSSITPRTDNYYVLGNNNYKWYAVTAYNVNVHDAITIEAGKELRFKDNNGVVHTLKYDSDKEAFVFDGNVNASGEMSAKKLNA